MIAERFIAAAHDTVSALMLGTSWNGWVSLPDWFGIFRTVMMALGGLVVVAIVLVVAVAVVSGVMGMIGNIKKKG